MAEAELGGVFNPLRALKGKGKRYEARYARSLRSLLDNGPEWLQETKGPRGGELYVYDSRRWPQGVEWAFDGRFYLYRQPGLDPVRYAMQQTIRGADKMQQLIHDLRTRGYVVARMINDEAKGHEIWTVFQKDPCLELVADIFDGQVRLPEIWKRDEFRDRKRRRQEAFKLILQQHGLSFIKRP